MNIIPTDLEGTFIVENLRFEDNRGTFQRLWCQRDGAAAGLRSTMVQTSLSVSRKQGTLRGLHFQLPPSREDKLVRCLSGRVYDVALDLRPRSRSYLQHVAVELADPSRALYIPAGCAHGFFTLADDSVVLYMMTDFYDPALSTGVRWDDPAFGIRWPGPPREIVERDASYPDFDPRTVEAFADHV